MPLDMDQVREQLEELVEAFGDDGDGAATTIGSGLDDFTAIDGVGPVTAQKLHNEKLYTYEDLRAFMLSGQRIDGVSPHTMSQIAGWLYEYEQRGD